MEHLANRSLYLTISANPNFLKSVSCLSKVSNLQYSTKQNKEKRMKCIVCQKHFQSSLMLILHIQLIHYKVIEVSNYLISDDTMTIQCKQFSKSYKSTVYSALYMKKLSTDNRKKPDFYLQYNIQQRCKGIINGLISKISKKAGKREQIFFHSNDIFRRIDEQSMDEDSEEDVGEIQRQLEKLKIQDFTDINQSDKNFFIRWNEFIHSQRKKLNVIFTHDMPKLFTDFSKNSPSLGISRLNIIMHGWSLWSVGQIKSEDLVKGLFEYDKIVNAEK